MRSLSHSIMRFWQPLVLALLQNSTRPLQVLPRSTALRFGTHLGRFACFVAGRQRRRSNANLHLAFGDTLSPKERQQLTRRTFEHFGRSVVEFLRFPNLSADQVASLVTGEGWEHVEEAMRHGNGVVLVTGHIGNWEIMGRWLATVQKLPLTVVAKDPSNPAFARYIRQMREGAGFAVLSKGESARTLLQMLKQQQAICLLADQNSADIFAPFFNIPTGTVAGPTSLALHARAALIPIYCLQQPDGRYIVRCEPPIPVPAEGSRKAQALEMTTAMNASLERVVRAYPDQWLWLHNRWKASFDPRFQETIWADHKNESATSGEYSYQQAYRRWSGS